MIPDKARMWDNNVGLRVTFNLDIRPYRENGNPENLPVR
jgi:hypothetical protein